MARGRVKERSIDLLCLVSSDPLVYCGPWKPWTTPLDLNTSKPADSHTAQRLVAGQGVYGWTIDNRPGRAAPVDPDGNPTRLVSRYPRADQDRYEIAHAQLPRVQRQDIYLLSARLSARVPPPPSPRHALSLPRSQQVHKAASP